jgi:hypothetical protein
MSDTSKWEWVRVPIIEKLDIREIWEHRPVDYYRYGEYPRDLRKPGVSDRFLWKWEKRKIRESK